jgi:hypothetical protein
MAGAATFRRNRAVIAGANDRIRANPHLCVADRFIVDVLAYGDSDVRPAGIISASAR